MIEIKNLHHNLLQVKRLSIERGHTAVIGPNGSGKTTLLQLCAGIELPDCGTILIGGELVREQNVGWVSEFPDRNQVFDRVRDEISSPLRFTHTKCDITDRLVNEIAGRLGIEELLQKSGRQISGGEKALVALATALVSKPALLVLDEVDSHLDRQTTEKIQFILQNCSPPYVIQCTQHMEIAAMADHVIFLKNGHIHYSGSPEFVFDSLRETCFVPFSRRVKL
ncbi:MAG: energy-coupling factor ABC transporter ATP-binding protein [Euryarchaeota archaeon]|nr:energy-coupling factor ABC transporter ATP-binding protein [Euryarchaeota archaeon]